MSESTNPTTQSIADYLAQLLKDKKQIAAFPNVFLHVERLLDEEIGRVRSNLFQINGIKKEPLVLPDAQGPATTLSEKVYVPVKEHPDFNFVGRILGPRGMTAKQLEQETGCKIMVRGRGSMRDKKKEEQNRGKPNWEHLNDELHVLITVEDTENRAKLKLQRAVDEVKRLLIPADGEDELKKRQLMELAIINGTYRDSSIKSAAGGEDLRNSSLLASTSNLHQVNDTSVHQTDTSVLPHVAVSDDEWRNLALFAAAAESQRLLGPGGVPGLATPMRTPPTPLGAPLILSPRMQVPTSAAAAAASHLLNGSGAPPPLMSPADAAGLIYTPYATAADYANYASLTSPLLQEYTAEHAAVYLQLHQYPGIPSASQHSKQYSYNIPMNQYCIENEYNDPCKTVALIKA